MSKLQELIDEFCNDGVKYKSIDELLKAKKLLIVTPSFKVKKNEYKSKGKIPIVSQEIEKISGYYDDFDKNIPKDKYICFGDHSEHIKFIDFPFVQGADGLKIIKANNANINAKFIFYAISNNYNRYNNYERHFKYLCQVNIPIPPIEVQNEIVRILDNFTELEAELKAELEARKEQYNYFFYKLMNSNQYKKIKLSEIGKVKMCKRILKNQTTPEGDIPFYKIGTFGKKADAYISEETFKELKDKYSYPKKGDILISCSGTIGRTVVFDGKPAYFQDSNIVWLEHDETIITNSFLKYCYRMSPWTIATGGTIARLYNDNILNAEVLVPPLDEQQKIVSILDRFDKLCNDIFEGLPAEIEARRKQYEYYRDKLLNFKELKVENKE